MEPTRPSPAGPGSAQWTSRSIGSRFGHRVFYLFIRYAGRQGAYLLLYFVVLFYVLFTPKIRRMADHYLMRRFTGKNFIQRLADSYRIYINLGKALIDRAVIGILGTDKIRMEFRKEKDLFALLEEGKGLILMTAHVGCWQAAMASIKFMNVPVHLLLQREEGDIDLHYYEHSGGRRPFGIIDPRGYMGGVLEMMDVLKKGQVLSVMGDRLLGSRKGAAAVDFLGGKVLFPFSAFKIAAATGAPIGVLFSSKSGPYSYELELAGVIRVPPDAGKRNRDFLPYVTEFARALESFTEAHPYQFFNFYNLWEADGLAA